MPECYHINWLIKIRTVSIVIMVIMATCAASSITNSYAQKEITLRALLDDLADPGRWDTLIQPALQELRARHPDANINIKYEQFPYNDTRNTIVTAMTNQTPIDIVSVDQIWLGEFAERGFLTDLTNYTKKWGRSSDWYAANWDGGVYEGKIYGIWTWTDVRGMWYWKDMLKTAGVDPNSLTTWSGYLTAAGKLEVLKRNGTESMYLVAASHSPDLWYPYLWMLGGSIVEYKDNHPKRGSYWFPTYNSSQGVRALEFVRDQVKVGIKPQVEALHQAQDFANRKFAVSLDGSWVPGAFPPEEQRHLEQKVGFLPVFPISSHDTNHSSTLMGGWELSIPTTSKNKDLAWELITIILEPKFLSPWISKFGYLPTQSVIGEAFRTNSSSSTFPYYNELIGMIPFGNVRPSIPEYSLIAKDVKEAIDSVLFEGKDVNLALQEAALKSAKSLGW
jgi:multiple sugar transport system substrate-binding protein